MVLLSLPRVPTETRGDAALMPPKGKVTGTGERLFVCENCGYSERLAYASIGLEKPCGSCGGTCYCEPFPANEVMRRLLELSRRLEAEDGPLGVEV